MRAQEVRGVDGCGQALLAPACPARSWGVLCREHRAGVAGFVSCWFYFVCFGAEGNAQKAIFRKMG